jgi:hypothetical protein
MFRRSVSAFLLAVFAAVSLLGHGGLHLVPGGHDCHAHTGTAAAPAGHSHAGHTHSQAAHSHIAHSQIAQGHAHCCSHSHAENEQPSQPVPHAPFEHDHDNCLVCQWHTQGQLSTVTITVPLSEDCCGDVTRSTPHVTTAFRLSTLLTRGPPVA